uniref:Uncharacterized protein llpY n=1 Tax=Streptomyces tendae TaxID=1932 RepID=A7DWH7_STRTE|nr:hypothetical protein [Streptomyces tendae]
MPCGNRNEPAAVAQFGRPQPVAAGQRTVGARHHADRFGPECAQRQGSGVERCPGRRDVDQYRRLPHPRPRGRRAARTVTGRHLAHHPGPGRPLAAPPQAKVPWTVSGSTRTPPGPTGGSREPDFSYASVKRPGQRGFPVVGLDGTHKLPAALSCADSLDQAIKNSVRPDRPAFDKRMASRPPAQRYYGRGHVSYKPERKPIPREHPALAYFRRRVPETALPSARTVFDRTRAPLPAQSGW